MNHTPDEWSLFLEITPDLIIIAGKDGYFKKVNPAVIAKLGYSQEELYASPISSFQHPDDKEKTYNTRQEMLAGKELLNFENRYITKQGDIVWLHWTSIYFPESEVVFAIAKDITVRKHIEMEVEEESKKFKGLASHFKNSIEKERKYFAYQLHEELAQLAAAIKMDVEAIAGLSVSNEEAKARSEHAVVVTGMLLKSIQRLSFAISPKMMDDFGLNATLEWLCNEFSILNGIPCSFESAYDENKLSQEMRMDFFRICQQALTNVIDHAEASNVNIRIEEANGRIKLTVTDDGKGFDTNQQDEGLINMRRLATSINGRLTVESSSGTGTKINVSIPWVEVQKVGIGT